MFEGAFQCSKCPQSNDKTALRACPAWWETVLTNKEGEMKVEKSCAFLQLPVFLVEVIKSSAKSAEMGSEVRNDLQTVKENVNGQLGALHSIIAPQFKRPGITARVAYTYDQTQPAILTNQSSDKFTDDPCWIGRQSPS